MQWSLINLTAEDVASASGGVGVKVAVLDGFADCRHTDLSGRSSNVLVPRGKFRFPDSHGTHTAGIAAVRDGRIKKANIVALEAMGGEFTWGTSIIRSSFSISLFYNFEFCSM